MAVTFDEIESFLKEKGLKYDFDSNNNAIITGIVDGQNSALVFIRALEDGDFFQLQMEPMREDATGEIYPLDVDYDHANILEFLTYILMRNHIYKFGNWEYNYKSGDLRFAIAMPLNKDTKMTSTQFDRIISMAYTALYDIENIISVLQTGEIPETSMEDELEKLLLQKLRMATLDETSDEDDGI